MTSEERICELEARITKLQVINEKMMKIIQFLIAGEIESAKWLIVEIQYQELAASRKK